MHRLKISQENYDDISSIFMNEIKQVFLGCFGKATDDQVLPVSAPKGAVFDKK